MSKLIINDQSINNNDIDQQIYQLNEPSITYTDFVLLMSKLTARDDSNNKPVVYKSNTYIKESNVENTHYH